MNEKKSVFKNSTFWVIVSLVLVYPIGVILMWILKKSWKLWVKILITVVAVLLLGNTIANPPKTDVSTTKNNVVTQSKDDSVKKAEEAKKAEEKTKADAEKKAAEDAAKKAEEEKKAAEASVTISQKNAKKKAEQYLATMAFSESGLIKQLEFEKFSKEDATYAVNNIKVDWKEQAVKKGKSYLDMTGFSKNGLIQQLEFDGFTREQATYGASQNGLQ